MQIIVILLSLTERLDWQSCWPWDWVFLQNTHTHMPLLHTQWLGSLTEIGRDKAVWHFQQPDVLPHGCFGWTELCVCYIVRMCVGGGSEIDRDRLTENRKYTFVRMKWLIFSRTWRCPYSVSAFRNHTARKSWSAACICNLCCKKIQPAYPTLQQSNLLIFASHFPCWVNFTR